MSNGSQLLLEPVRIRVRAILSKKVIHRLVLMGMSLVLQAVIPPGIRLAVKLAVALDTILYAVLAVTAAARLAVRMADIRFAVIRYCIGSVTQNCDIPSFLENTGRVPVFADPVVLSPVGDANYPADKGNDETGFFQFVQAVRVASTEPHNAQRIADKAIIIRMVLRPDYN